MPLKSFSQSLLTVSFTCHSETLRWFFARKLVETKKYANKETLLHRHFLMGLLSQKSNAIVRALHSEWIDCSCLVQSVWQNIATHIIVQVWLLIPSGFSQTWNYCWNARDKFKEMLILKVNFTDCFEKWKRCWNKCVKRQRYYCPI